jgi:hypothetical protein
MYISLFKIALAHYEVGPAIALVVEIQPESALVGGNRIQEVALNL